MIARGSFTTSQTYFTDGSWFSTDCTPGNPAASQRDCFSYSGTSPAIISVNGFVALIWLPALTDTLGPESLYPSDLTLSTNIETGPTKISTEAESAYPITATLSSPHYAVT